jgi:voltage-gated potassium channel Kch
MSTPPPAEPAPSDRYAYGAPSDRSPNGKKAAFAARSRVTPVMPLSRTETVTAALDAAIAASRPPGPSRVQQVEESVQVAVKEASEAAARVEVAMAEAIRAAEAMEAGVERDTALASVIRSAAALRLNYSQYERLEEELADAIEPLKTIKSNRCKAAYYCVYDSFWRLVRIFRDIQLAVLELLSQLSKPGFFFLSGCLVYSYLEGWSPLDTVYFLMVTSTTVGYGDVYPTTPLGKFVTIFYALFGIVVVLGSLAPLVQFLRGSWREDLVKLFVGGPTVNVNDPTLTMDEINARLGPAFYRQRYALAALGPGLVIASGVLLHFTLIREPRAEVTPVPILDALGLEVRIDWLGLLDSIYWSVITATTIGYGDVHPVTQLSKLFAILYLPLAVIAIADAISDFNMIQVKRRIRETDFAGKADECLLNDAVRDDGPPNLEPVLNEAEFLIDQLKEGNLVSDEEAITVINKQFAFLTRRQALANADEARKLTPRMVYEELRDRVRSGKPISEGATKYDLTPEGTWRWSSYEEWSKKSWRVRVLLRHTDKEGGVLDAAGHKSSGGAKAGEMRTILGAARGSVRRG